MSNLLFSNNYSEDYSVMPHGIVQDNDGSFIFVGRAFISDFVSSGFATKITPGGNIIWSNTYSQPFNQFFSALTKLEDGTFVATGSYFYSPAAGNEYVWVFRFDSDGNVLFQDALGVVGIQSDGIDICATKDGGYAILVNSVENAIVKPSILKFDLNNTLVWQQFYGVGRGLAITSTADNGFAITGAIDTKGSLNSKIFVLRADSQGTELWKEIYDEYEIYVLLNAGIIENKVGHFVIVAKSVIMEVGPCGKLIWSKQIENLNLSLILESANNEYIIAGAVILSNVDHAYITSIDYNGEFTKWNNTELLPSSEFTGLTLTTENYPLTCAYAPVQLNKSQSVITVFDKE